MIGFNNLRFNLKTSSNPLAHDGALQDANGNYILDGNANYITTTEN